MESPHVDAVFGAHVDPNLPAGQVAVKYGNFYATSDIFTATVHGVSTHGAEPHNGIDPIVVGAQIVMALQTIPSGRVPLRQPVQHHQRRGQNCGAVPGLRHEKPGEDQSARSPGDPWRS